MFSKIDILKTKITPCFRTVDEKFNR